MLVNCATCKKTIAKNKFSKNQLRNKNQIGYPRCKQCIGNIENCDKSRNIIENVNIPDSEIIPPKRLVMIRENDCDFCEYDFKSKTTMKFIDYYLYPHTGWQVCEKCKKICDRNFKNFTIDKSILQDKFPNGKFKVIRSDGTIENDWYVAGNAIRYDIKNDYKVAIYNQKEATSTILEKCIGLKLLESWQI